MQDRLPIDCKFLFSFGDRVQASLVKKDKDMEGNVIYLPTKKVEGIVKNAVRRENSYNEYGIEIDNGGVIYRKEQDIKLIKKKGS